MSGVKLRIDDKEFRRKVKALGDGIDDPLPLIKVWGEIVQTSISENFERGGRPARWTPLSQVTIRLKGHAVPLRGRTGNLARITIAFQRSTLIVGTAPAARDYAAIQQFGGNAGRNRKVRIPARPFILLQAEDKKEMAAEARVFFKRLAT